MTFFLQCFSVLLLFGVSEAKVVWSVPITDWTYGSYKISLQCTPFRQHIIKYATGIFFWFIYFLSRWFTRRTWPELKGKKLMHFLNINVSLTHSMISSCLLTLAFITNFENMIAEPFWNQCVFMDIIVAMSLGYFIYDLAEWVINGSYKIETNVQRFNIIVHHAGTICILGFHSFGCLYSGWTGVTLVMEYNSIFLHTRRQMLAVGSDKRYPRLFSFVVFAQYFTFIFFRFCFLIVMHMNHLLDKERVLERYTGYYMPGVVFFFPLFHILNGHLFYRIANSDHKYFMEKRKLEKEKNKMYKYGSMRLLVEGRIC